MNDDTVYNYLGKEAEWVALCGFQAVESGGEAFSESDAAELIEFVWEFCEESCKAANARIPQKEEAIERLAAMIGSWNAEQKSDEV
jgi:hypothetical protein